MMCFWTHKWSNWKTYVWVGDEYCNNTGNEARKVDETRQARICERCKIEEHRIVRGAWGATYEGGDYNESKDSPGTSIPQAEPQDCSQSARQDQGSQSAP